MNETQTRTVHGLAMYLRPAFMLPAVGTSAYGGLLAGSVRPLSAVLHGLAVGLALYVAHLVDGYVDAHVRGEEPPLLPARTNLVAAGGSSALFFLVLVALAVTTSPSAAAATLPLWLLAVAHAPSLDVNPVAVTVDYPLGIGITVLGGYIAQTNGLSGSVLAVALTFAVLLTGVKVSIDRLDYAFDRSIDKRTVPVTLGDETAIVASAAVLVFAASLVGGFVAAGTLPPLAVTACAFPLLAAATGFVCSKQTAVRLQMLLTYPFAAALFVACVPQ